MKSNGVDRPTDELQKYKSNKVTEEWIDENFASLPIRARILLGILGAARLAVKDLYYVTAEFRGSPFWLTSCIDPHLEVETGINPEKFLYDEAFKHARQSYDDRNITGE